jgi:hypothetical protein
VNSIEKIHQLATDYEGAPSADADVIELTFRSAVTMAGPMIIGSLPDDPVVIDHGLEYIAGKLLELRSDEREHTVKIVGELPPAEQIEEPA